MRWNQKVHSSFVVNCPVIICYLPVIGGIRYLQYCSFEMCVVQVGQLLSIVVLASSSDSAGELYSRTIDDKLKYAEALIFVLL